MTEKEPKVSMATLIVQLAMKECIEFWNDHTGDGFADYRSELHTETMRIRSTEFRLFLKRLFFESEERATNNQAVAEAIDTLEGRAIFQGTTHKSNVRIGHHDAKIYLDLGNPQWQVIEIGEGKWSVCEYSASPIKFVRPKGLLPLPMPNADGQLSELRSLINVSDDDWNLIVAFLLSVFQPKGAFPILFVHGEQGSAKSTASRIIRQVIDDNACPVRAKARDEDALLIAARNGAIVALDNLSFIDDAFSDSLCRLATGAGLSKRTLYSDLDETVLSVKRPVVVNGIPELASRGDLLSRSLTLHLPAIADCDRKTEAEIEGRFEQIRASCLGGLLNAVSHALKNQGKIRSDWLPRLADFYLWVLAAEGATGLKAGEFGRTYRSRIEALNRQAVDNSLVGSAILDFASVNPRWEGNCSRLLEQLESRLDRDTRFRFARNKSWPKSGRAMSTHLRRLAPDLRKLGLQIEFDIDGRRTLRLTLANPDSDRDDRDDFDFFND